MAEEITILQHWIFSDFLFPFLLVFFIVFAILERTKIFGEDKKQVNALLALVIGLIFVGAVYPKLVVGRLTLFLAVAIVSIFVLMLIWGFIFGDFDSGFKALPWMKYIVGIISGLAFLGAIVWATGWYENIANFVTNKGIGQTIISNVIILAVIIFVLVIALKSSTAKK